MHHRVDGSVNGVGLAHVVSTKRERRLVAQMGDVVDRSGEKTVQSKHLVTALDESFAEMRTEKTCTTSDDDPNHEDDHSCRASRDAATVQASIEARDLSLPESEQLGPEPRNARQGGVIADELEKGASVAEDEVAEPRRLPGEDEEHDDRVLPIRRQRIEESAGQIGLEHTEAVEAGERKSVENRRDELQEGKESQGSGEGR